MLFQQKNFLFFNFKIKILYNSTSHLHISFSKIKKMKIFTKQEKNSTSSKIFTQYFPSIFSNIKLFFLIF